VDFNRGMYVVPFMCFLFARATVDDGSPWPNAASWAVVASSDHFFDGGTEYMSVYYEYG
jgi:hypothetical protein